MTIRDGRSDRVAILGAGCAGLSLAVELLERAPSLRVILLDRKERFARDRTWCGWTLPDAAYDHCVTHRWSRCQVRNADLETTMDVAMYPYRHIPADRYYAEAVELLDRTGRCEIRLGENVSGVDCDQDGATVRTAAARERVGHVFDGRLTPETLRGFSGPSLYQAFCGHEVVADRDVFDPQTATLMDFDVSQQDGTHFFYVLPFSSRKALVEATFLLPNAEIPPDCESRIDAYLRRRYALDRWTLIRRESGCIPMSTTPPPQPGSPNHWLIGTASGVVKPSTGYAFDAIHRDSRRVADAWLAGRPRPRPPRSALALWMDRLMISLLRARPELGRRVFPELMSRCPTERMIRFLADGASLRDLFAVVRATPTMPLLAHALQSRGGRV